MGVLGWFFMWVSPQVAMYFVLGASALFSFILYCVRPRALGRAVSLMMSLMLRGAMVRKFSVEEVHVGHEPRICGLEVETWSKTMYQPEVLVKWSKLKVTIQWKRLFIPFYATIMAYSARYLRHYNKLCCKWRWDPLGISKSFATKVDANSSSSSDEKEELNESYRRFKRDRTLEMDMLRNVNSKIMVITFEDFYVKVDKLQYSDFLRSSKTAAAGGEGGSSAGAGNSKSHPSFPSSSSSSLSSSSALNEDEHRRALRRARKESGKKKSSVFGKLFLTDILIERMMLSVRLFLTKNLDIRFERMSFDMNFRSEKMHASGAAQEVVMCGVHGASKHSIHHGVLMCMSVANGSMRVLNDRNIAMVFSASKASIKVDVHLPSGLQDITMTLGEDKGQKIVPRQEQQQRYQSDSVGAGENGSKGAGRVGAESRFASDSEDSDTERGTGNDSEEFSDGEDMYSNATEIGAVPMVRKNNKREKIVSRSRSKSSSSHDDDDDDNDDNPPEMTLWMEPFLSFYSRYASAEDIELELKMAVLVTESVPSSMRSINMIAPKMRVVVKHAAMLSCNVMVLHNLKAMLANYKCNNKGKPIFTYAGAPSGLDLARLAGERAKVQAGGLFAMRHNNEADGVSDGGGNRARKSVGSLNNARQSREDALSPVTTSVDSNPGAAPGAVLAGKGGGSSSSSSSSSSNVTESAPEESLGVRLARSDTMNAQPPDLSGPVIASGTTAASIATGVGRDGGGDRENSESLVADNAAATAGMMSDSDSEDDYRDDSDDTDSTPTAQKHMTVTCDRVVWPLHDDISATGRNTHDDNGLSSTPSGGESTEERSDASSSSSSSSKSRAVGRDSQMRAAFVEGMEFKKVLRIRSGSPYIDSDQQDITLRQVHFRGMEPEMLQWLFLLQNMSDRLPNSRFSHLKHVQMNINVKSLCFGAEPTNTSDTHLGEIFTPDAALVVAKGMLAKAKESANSKKIHLAEEDLQDAGREAASSSSSPSCSATATATATAAAQHSMNSGLLRKEGESDFQFMLRAVQRAAGHVHNDDDQYTDLSRGAASSGSATGNVPRTSSVRFALDGTEEGNTNNSGSGGTDEKEEDEEEVLDERFCYNPSYEEAVEKQVLFYFTELEVATSKRAGEDQTHYDMQAASFEIESEMDVRQVEALQNAVGINMDNNSDPSSSDNNGDVDDGGTSDGDRNSPQENSDDCNIQEKPCERLGSHWMLADFKVTFAMGGGIFMEELGVSSMAIDVFSHFEHIVELGAGQTNNTTRTFVACPPPTSSISSSPVSLEKSTTTARYATGRYHYAHPFVRTSGFTTTWRGDSDTMNLLADLQVVSVDASTSCMLRFWASYNCVMAYIERVTGTMTKATFLDSSGGASKTAKPGQARKGMQRMREWDMLTSKENEYVLRSIKHRKGSGAVDAAASAPAPSTFTGDDDLDNTGADKQALPSFESTASGVLTARNSAIPGMRVNVAKLLVNLRVGPSADIALAEGHGAGKQIGDTITVSTAQLSRLGLLSPEVCAPGSSAALSLEQLGSLALSVKSDPHWRAIVTNPGQSKDHKNSRMWAERLRKGQQPFDYAQSRLHLGVGAASSEVTPTAACAVDGSKKQKGVVRCVFRKQRKFRISSGYTAEQLLELTGGKSYRAFLAGEGVRAGAQADIEEEPDHSSGEDDGEEGSSDSKKAGASEEAVAGSSSAPDGAAGDRRGVRLSSLGTSLAATDAPADGDGDGDASTPSGGVRKRAYSSSISDIRQHQLHILTSPENSRGSSDLSSHSSLDDGGSDWDFSESSDTDSSDDDASIHENKSEAAEEPVSVAASDELDSMPASTKRSESKTNTNHTRDFDRGEESTTARKQVGNSDDDDNHAATGSSADYSSYTGSSTYGSSTESSESGSESADDNGDVTKREHDDTEAIRSISPNPRHSMRLDGDEDNTQHNPMFAQRNSARGSGIRNSIAGLAGALKPYRRSSAESASPAPSTAAAIAATDAETSGASSGMLLPPPTRTVTSSHGSAKSRLSRKSSGSRSSKHGARSYYLNLSGLSATDLFDTSNNVTDPQDPMLVIRWGRYRSGHFLEEGRVRTERKVDAGTEAAFDEKMRIELQDPNGNFGTAGSRFSSSNNNNNDSNASSSRFDLLKESKGSQLEFRVEVWNEGLLGTHQHIGEGRLALNSVIRSERTEVTFEVKLMHSPIWPKQAFMQGRVTMTAVLSKHRAGDRVQVHQDKHVNQSAASPTLRTRLSALRGSLSSATKRFSNRTIDDKEDTANNASERGSLRLENSHTRRRHRRSTASKQRPASTRQSDLETEGLLINFAIQDKPLKLEWDECSLGSTDYCFGEHQVSSDMSSSDSSSNSSSCDSNSSDSSISNGESESNAKRKCRSGATRDTIIEVEEESEVTYLVDPGTYVNLEFECFRYVLVPDIYPLPKLADVDDESITRLGIQAINAGAEVDLGAGTGVASQESREEEDADTSHGRARANSEFTYKNFFALHDWSASVRNAAVADRPELERLTSAEWLAREVANHLPTRYVNYAWADCAISFNNHDGKPLFRMKDFAYSVTTRHVDVAATGRILTDLADSAGIQEGSPGDGGGHTSHSAASESQNSSSNSSNTSDSDRNSDSDDTPDDDDHIHHHQGMHSNIQRTPVANTPGGRRSVASSRANSALKASTDRNKRPSYITRRKQMLAQFADTSNNKNNLSDRKAERGREEDKGSDLSLSDMSSDDAFDMAARFRDRIEASDDGTSSSESLHFSDDEVEEENKHARRRMRATSTYSAYGYFGNPNTHAGINSPDHHPAIATVSRRPPTRVLDEMEVTIMTIYINIADDTASSDMAGARRGNGRITRGQQLDMFNKQANLLIAAMMPASSAGAQDEDGDSDDEDFSDEDDTTGDDDDEDNDDLAEKESGPYTPTTTNAPGNSDSADRAEREWGDLTEGIPVVASPESFDDGNSSPMQPPDTEAARDDDNDIDSGVDSDGDKELDNEAVFSSAREGPSPLPWQETQQNQNQKPSPCKQLPSLARASKPRPQPAHKLYVLKVAIDRLRAFVDVVHPDTGAYYPGLVTMSIHSLDLLLDSTLDNEVAFREIEALDLGPETSEEENVADPVTRKHNKKGRSEHYHGSHRDNNGSASTSRDLDSSDSEPQARTPLTLNKRGGGCDHLEGLDHEKEDNHHDGRTLFGHDTTFTPQQKKKRKQQQKRKHYRRDEDTELGFSSSDSDDGDGKDGDGTDDASHSSSGSSSSSGDGISLLEGKEGVNGGKRAALRQGLSDGNGLGVVYSAYSGGYLTTTMQALIIRSQTQPEPIAILRQVELNGPLYMAGLANAEVPVLSKMEYLAPDSSFYGEGSAQTGLERESELLSQSCAALAITASEQLCPALSMEGLIERENMKRPEGDTEEDEDYDEEEDDDDNDDARDGGEEDEETDGGGDVGDQDLFAEPETKVSAKPRGLSPSVSDYIYTRSTVPPPPLWQFGLRVSKSAATYKYYGELSLTVAALHIALDQTTVPSWNLALSVVNTFLPAADQDITEGPRMDHWDKHRFQYHGSLTLGVEQLVVESTHKALNRHHQKRPNTAAAATPTAAAASTAKNQHPHHNHVDGDADSDEDTVLAEKVFGGGGSSGRNRSASQGTTNSAAAGGYESSRPPPLDGTSRSLENAVRLRLIARQFQLCLDHKLVEVCARDLDVSVDYERKLPPTSIRMRRDSSNYWTDGTAAGEGGGAAAGGGMPGASRQQHRGSVDSHVETHCDHHVAVTSRLAFIPGILLAFHHRRATPHHHSPSSPPAGDGNNGSGVDATAELPLLPQLTVEESSSRFYAHHDVFLLPTAPLLNTDTEAPPLVWDEKGEAIDKFRDFRLVSGSMEWSVELVLLDDACPVTLFLRIESAFRALDPWLNPDDYMIIPSGDSSHDTTTGENSSTGGESNDNPTNNNDLEPIPGKLTSYVYNRADPPDPLEGRRISFMDLPRKVNIQVHVKKLLVMSWSGNECSGFAFLQQRMDLQLRLLRQRPEKGLPPPQLVLQSAANANANEGSKKQAGGGSSSTQKDSQHSDTAHTKSPSSPQKGKKDDDGTTASNDNINNSKTDDMKPPVVTVGPLLVAHMFCELERMDLYMRQWGVPTHGTAGSIPPPYFVAGSSRYRSHFEEVAAASRAEAAQKEKSFTMGSKRGKKIVQERAMLALAALRTPLMGCALPRMKKPHHRHYSLYPRDGAMNALDSAVAACDPRSIDMCLRDGSPHFSVLSSHIAQQQQIPRAYTGWTTFHGAVLQPPSLPLDPSQIQMSGGRSGPSQLTREAVHPFFVANDSRLSTGRDMMEPRSLSELEGLLVPLHLLAHSSKVEVSLTEGGGVAGKAGDFTNSGIMDQLERQNAAAIAAAARVAAAETAKAALKERRRRSAIYSFKTGVDGPNPVMVCPVKGIMAGECVAAKKSANVRAIATALGGKPTKRRWYELDAGYFKYCESRERYPDEFKEMFHVRDIIQVRSYSTNKRLLAAAAYTFEITVAVHHHDDATNGKTTTSPVTVSHESSATSTVEAAGQGVATSTSSTAAAVVIQETRLYELGVQSIFDHDSWILALKRACKVHCDGLELEIMDAPYAAVRKITRRVTVRDIEKDDVPTAVLRSGKRGSVRGSTPTKTGKRVSISTGQGLGSGSVVQAIHEEEEEHGDENSEERSGSAEKKTTKKKDTEESAKDKHNSHKHHPVDRGGMQHMHTRVKQHGPQQIGDLVIGGTMRRIPQRLDQHPSYHALVQAGGTSLAPSPTTAAGGTSQSRPNTTGATAAIGGGGGGEGDTRPPTQRPLSLHVPPSVRAQARSPLKRERASSTASISAHIVGATQQPPLSPPTATSSKEKQPQVKGHERRRSASASGGPVSMGKAQSPALGSVLIADFRRDPLFLSPPKANTSEELEQVSAPSPHLQQASAELPYSPLHIQRTLEAPAMLLMHFHSQNDMFGNKAKASSLSNRRHRSMKDIRFNKLGASSISGSSSSMNNSPAPGNKGRPSSMLAPADPEERARPKSLRITTGISDKGAGTAEACIAAAVVASGSSSRPSSLRIQPSYSARSRSKTVGASSSSALLDLSAKRGAALGKKYAGAGGDGGWEISDATGSRSSKRSTGGAVASTSGRHHGNNKSGKTKKLRYGGVSAAREGFATDPSRSSYRKLPGSSGGGKKGQKQTKRNTAILLDSAGSGGVSVDIHTSTHMKAHERRWDSRRDGVRAWLFDFRFNHRAFMPPGPALPPSYRQSNKHKRGDRDRSGESNRHRTHLSASPAVQLAPGLRPGLKISPSGPFLSSPTDHAAIGAAHAVAAQHAAHGHANAPPGSDGGTLNGASGGSGANNNASVQATDGGMFGDKIWGLRVVDLRLLWTILMRDVLYVYVSRYFRISERREANRLGHAVKRIENKGRENSSNSVTSDATGANSAGAGTTISDSEKRKKKESDGTDASSAATAATTPVTSGNGDKKTPSKDSAAAAAMAGESNSSMPPHAGSKEESKSAQATAAAAAAAAAASKQKKNEPKEKKELSLDHHFHLRPEPLADTTAGKSRQYNPLKIKEGGGSRPRRNLQHHSRQPGDHDHQHNTSPHREDRSNTLIGRVMAAGRSQSPVDHPTDKDERTREMKHENASRGRLGTTDGHANRGGGGVIWEDSGGGILTARRDRTETRVGEGVDDEDWQTRLVQARTQNALAALTSEPTGEGASSTGRVVGDWEKKNEEEEVDYELDTADYHSTSSPSNSSRSNGSPRISVTGFLSVSVDGGSPPNADANSAGSGGSGQRDSPDATASLSPSSRKKVTFAAPGTGDNGSADGSSSGDKNKEVSASSLSSSSSQPWSSSPQEPAPQTQSLSLHALREQKHKQQRHRHEHRRPTGSSHGHGHSRSGTRRTSSRDRSRAFDASAAASAAASEGSARWARKKEEAAAALLAARSLPRRFFFVELVDPQINFLDDKEHCSLIVVTGRSTLEGRRAAVGVQPTGYTDINGVILPGFTPGPDPVLAPLPEDADPEDVDVQPRIDRTTGVAYVPKKAQRRVDLGLRMDGVSVFTVHTQPSDVNGNSHRAEGSSSRREEGDKEEDTEVNEGGASSKSFKFRARAREDIVHWKRMHHTSTMGTSRLDSSGGSGGNDNPNRGGMKAAPQGSGVRGPRSVPSAANTSSSSFSYSSSGRANNQQQEQRGGGGGDGGKSYDTASGRDNASCRLSFGSHEIKTAITDFDVRANYNFWSDLPAAEARKMIVERRAASLSSEFTLELAKIEMDVDSPQFFILANVTRNVLLEPPPKLQKDHTSHRRRNDSSSSFDNEKHRSTDPEAGNSGGGGRSGVGRSSTASGFSDSTLSSRVPAHTDLFGFDDDDRKSYARASMTGGATDGGDIGDEYDDKDDEDEDAADESKALVVEFDQELLMREGLKITAQELHSLSTLTREAYRAIHVLVDNSLNRPLEVEEGVEREVRVVIGEGTWILRTDDDAETVTTSFTGVEAQFKYHPNRQFETYFTVQRFSVLRKDLVMNTENWVIQPNVVDMEPCVRCNQHFKMEDNHAHACGQHANSDGTPGVYKERRVVDPLSGAVTKAHMWSCCGVQARNAPFCAYHHHQFKEKMLQVNAMANPKARIENIDVTVLTEIDISVFPGADYDLRLQVSRSLTNVFYSYFRLSGEQQANAGEGAVAVVTDPAVSATTSVREGNNAGTSSLATVKEIDEGGYFGRAMEGGTTIDNMNAKQSHLHPHYHPQRPSLQQSESANSSDSSKHQYSIKKVVFPGKEVDEENEQYGGSANSRSGPNDRVRPDSYAEMERTMRHQEQELDETYSTPTGSVPYQEAAQERLRALHSTITYNLPSPGSAMSYGKEGIANALSMTGAGIIGNELNSAFTSSANHHNTTAPGSASAEGSASIAKVVEEEREEDAADAVGERMEVVFIRRLRMGGMKASINTTGFAFNFKELIAEIDPLTITGEALGWKDLGSQLLTHIGWSVAMHAKTSTIISSLFNWSGSSSSSGSGVPRPITGGPAPARRNDDPDGGLLHGDVGGTASDPLGLGAGAGAGAGGSSGDATQGGGGGSSSSSSSSNIASRSIFSGRIPLLSRRGHTGSHDNSQGVASYASRRKSAVDGTDPEASEAQHRGQVEKLLGKRTK